MKNNASSEAYPMKRKSWTDEMEDEFRELLKKKDAVCFITFADDRAVAFAQCYPISNRLSTFGDSRSLNVQYLGFSQIRMSILQGVF